MGDEYEAFAVVDSRLPLDNARSLRNVLVGTPVGFPSLRLVPAIMLRLGCFDVEGAVLDRSYRNRKTSSYSSGLRSCAADARPVATRRNTLHNRAPIVRTRPAISPSRSTLWRV